MASEWVHCTLADACREVNYGLTASASNHSVGPKFLRITDIVSGQLDWNNVPHVAADDECARKYQLHDGDIVIARTGASTGESLYIKNPPPSVFASYLVRLQINSDFDARFISYYLKSNEFWEFIRGVLGDKSAQPNASASTMISAPLSAPKDKVEQRAIAHVLGTLDDKIELNWRMNETLEEMARALFKSWFVDFDPVCTKMESRNPNLPEHIADLFPDWLVESELGEIPEGWKVKLFGDVVNRLRGNVNPGTYPDTVFSHFSIPAYDERQLPKEELGREIKSTKTRVPPGVVLLSKLNPEIERVWLVDVMEDETAVCSTEFLVLKAMPPIQRSYIYCLACNSLFREQIKSLVTGTSKSHQRVQVNAISKLEIVFPPEPIIQEFESRASELLNHGLACRREIKTLAALRDALLPKLVSGEIRLREAEKAVEVVT